MQTCPLAMAAKNGSDWCHFFARVARSKMHQKVKNCEMGYEDEKFSYIIATKEKYPLPTARLLRYPIIRTGHQILTLCTENGVSQQTVTKKDKHFYKMVKKLSWGDSLP